MEKVKIKVIKARMPKTCVCPHYGQKQRFKLNRRYYKYVKDMNLNTPVLLKVEMISAKCLNPACPKRCFNLPITGIERYQRATQRLIKESIR
jgi:hypothetical protein